MLTFLYLVNVFSSPVPSFIVMTLFVSDEMVYFTVLDCLLEKLRPSHSFQHTHQNAKETPATKPKVASFSKSMVIFGPAKTPNLGVIQALSVGETVRPHSV